MRHISIGAGYHWLE